MQKISAKETIFVFDLDDTLYSEREYERSGIAFVFKYLQDNGKTFVQGFNLEVLLENRKGWIDALIQTCTDPANISVEGLLEIYREHFPEIQLYPDAKMLLDYLKGLRVNIAIITDGRSLSQRQKIKALSLDHYADDFYISEEVGYEKPHPFSYEAIARRNPGCRFAFIGDNPKKDFLTPNRMGWQTIGLLDRGQNVHPQEFQHLEQDYRPQKWIKRLDELIGEIND